MKLVFLPSLSWSAVDAADGADAGEPGSVPRRFMPLLEERGFEVEVVEPTRAPLNPFPDDSFARGLDPVRALRMIAGRRRRVDAIISTFEAGAFLPALAKRLGLLRTRLVLWELNPDPHWRLRTRIQEASAPGIDLGLFLDQTQADYAASLRHSPSRCEVIGIHNDEDFWSPDPDRRQKGHLLTVGDDGSRDYRSLGAALAGSGLSLTVRSAGATLGEIDGVSVTMLRQRQSSAALRQLYREAEIVVLPLLPVLHAGGISALTEAMACGAAIVVSASPGIAGSLQHGVTAHVVPPGDPGALREGIERLRQDTDYAQTLRRGARHYAETYLSRSAFADRFAAALRR